jgi:DNA-binding beta-propeller fold protein YncE
MRRMRGALLAGVMLTAASAARASVGLAPLAEPAAVAVDAAGAIYVCEALGDRVSVFDAQGARLRGWGRPGRGAGELDGPRGIAVGDDGRVYVADTGNDRIQVFAPDGAFLSEWGRHGTGASELDGPEAIAAAGGRVYVADTGNNRIQVFRTDGSFLFYVWSYGWWDGAFDAPSAVAVAGDGSFLVGDRGNGRIQKFRDDGTFVAAWGGRGRRGALLLEPAGLEREDGTILVADPLSDRIVALDPAGELVGETGFEAPSAIASLPEGRIVVCSAVRNRCEIAPRRELLDPRAEPDARRPAREGYALGGAADAMVVASRETGVPFIVDLSRGAPSLLVTLGGPGREPLEFARPLGFDVDLARGVVLVADTGNNRIQRLRLARAAADPRRLDPSRTRYVDGIALDDEERLDVEPAAWTLDPATLTPGSIARDARGRILIADQVGRRIVALDRRFHLVTSWGGYGDDDGKLRRLSGIAVDPGGGSVFALDAGRRRIDVFDLDGKLRRAWGRRGDGPGEMSAPSGIAVARDGSVYVVDRAADRVVRFDASGSVLATWGSAGSAPGQLFKPEGVHVDGAGRVIVLDSGNRRLQAFSPSGAFLWEAPLDPASLPPSTLSRRALRAQPEAEARRYAVAIATEPAPIPLGQPFAMTVSVAEAGGGAPARNVILDVDGTMPEHHHGMSGKPAIVPLDGTVSQDLLPGHGVRGNDRFGVRGMLFHMPGRWEIHVDVTHGAITERAQVDVTLD